jgi:hypothetical protein
MLDGDDLGGCYCLAHMALGMFGHGSWHRGNIVQRSAQPRFFPSILVHVIVSPELA